MNSELFDSLFEFCPHERIEIAKCAIEVVQRNFKDSGKLDLFKQLVDVWKTLDDLSDTQLTLSDKVKEVLVEVKANNNVCKALKVAVQCVVENTEITADQRLYHVYKRLNNKIFEVMDEISCYL